jgi:hypothetical protein
VDSIEEYGGNLHGYEFRWGSNVIKPSTKKQFFEAYPGSTLEIVAQDNFEDFLE